MKREQPVYTCGLWRRDGQIEGKERRRVEKRDERGRNARVIMKLFRSFARGARALARVRTHAHERARACILYSGKKSKLVCHKFPDESCSERRCGHIMATIFHLRA